MSKNRTALPEPYAGRIARPRAARPRRKRAGQPVRHRMNPPWLTGFPGPAGVPVEGAQVGVVDRIVGFQSEASFILPDGRGQGILFARLGSQSAMGGAAV